MKHVRLPNHIRPQRYELFIKPNLEDFTFEGEETIELAIDKPSTEIVLHAKELKISIVEYKAVSSKQTAHKISYDQKSETVTLAFNRQIPKGKGELKLKFKGVLNDIMRGFYRSRYEHQGRQKHLATTQFEATDARRAFPCFDEPAQKAVFDVTLMVPKDLTAISNTIETSVLEHESGYKVVKFAPTPKMSTYLLAFIIGEFEHIESKTKDGTLVRVFVTPGKKHQAKFALDTAVRCLEFYNKYFDIPYPLPVLDLIAIPDFSTGAMENWGAVTYRESALLVDPEHSSASNKQWVALVIAHELAHQWFGNLVTMEWWTHLWLNEGFASYIEYLAVDNLFPSWEIWTQFAYNDLGVALKLDALKNTHPIEVEVKHPDEIGEIFDEVSYSKGASIIRMLAGFLGEKDFRDGLRYYLKKHSYKNASTVHLWEAFEKVSKKPVRKIMQNWTSKPGYPVVKVSESFNQIKLTQQRFFSSPISKRQIKDKTVWQVPVGIQSSEFRTQNLLFGQKNLDVNGKSKWIKLNAGEAGFYRTEYSAEMLESLRPMIAKKQLSALDRLGIIRDAFALAESGDLSTVEALKLLKAFKNETDYAVWVELTGGLAAIKNLIYGKPYYKQFENFACEIFKQIGKNLGFNASKHEPHTRGLLRSLILQQLIGYNHEPTIKQALKIHKNKKIPADIRAAVYAAAAQGGNASQHQKFISQYKVETLSEEKNRIGRALGQFSDLKLIKKTLNFAMSKDVRIQDTAGIFMSVWGNPLAKKTVWQFTKKHWRELLKRYPSSGHMLSRFIKPAGMFVLKTEGQEVEKFFKTHKASGGERAVAQALEKIYAQDLWQKRDGYSIGQWLKDNV